MEYKEGYIYHIKDSYFQKVNDDKLMINKEDNHYRPTFLCMKDYKNSLIWMIPMSSKIEKYQSIIKKQQTQYGKSLGIVIGDYNGKKSVFLIQNMFPVIEKYIDHIHTIDGIPMPVKHSVHKEIRSKLNQVMVLISKGKNIVFPDVKRLESIMINELKQQNNTIEAICNSNTQNIKPSLDDIINAVKTDSKELNHKNNNKNNNREMNL